MQLFSRLAVSTFSLPRLARWCAGAALLALASPEVRAQIVLSDNFNGPTINPILWNVVTNPIPQGGASVSILNGECRLVNRGHLVTQQAFDYAINPYRVTCRWKWTDAYDRFQVLVRSDGVPSGPYGETANGIEFLASMEAGSSAGIETRGSLVTLGSATIAGPGVTFAVGSWYSVQIDDLGTSIQARLDGPNGQWRTWNAPVLVDQTTVRRVVFHNRENLGQSHDCRIDDVVVSLLHEPRFFLGLVTTSSQSGTVIEVNTAGSVVATHQLSMQLPQLFYSGSHAQVRPCEITPWGTLLCTGGYHPQSGWFELDAAGFLGTFYPSAGGTPGNAIGPQGATATLNGQVVGAHYDWNQCELRTYSTSGQALWSANSTEALSPSIIGDDIYVGSFQVNPVQRWSLSAHQHVGSFGQYRHVFVTKAIHGTHLLVGNNAVVGSSTCTWIVRELATGTETQLATSAFATPNAWADVDDAGNVWVLCGSDLVRFDPLTGASTGVVSVGYSGSFTGLAVRGTPNTPLASYTPFGSGCPGPVGSSPTLFAVPGSRPRIGASSTITVNNLPTGVVCVPIFILGFSTTFDTSPAGSYPLPLDLGILGWSGCQQLVSINDTALTITNTGVASHTVSIPAIPLLAGLQFHAQALVLYSPSGVTVSNGITGTAGY
jgi:hypothetical protein